MELAYNGVQALLYSAIVYFLVGFDHSLGQQLILAQGIKPLVSPPTHDHCHS